MSNPIAEGVLPNGDTYSIHEFALTDEPTGEIPDGLRDLINRLKIESKVSHKVSDVCFFWHDDGPVVHATFETPGIEAPLGKTLRTAATFDYHSLPDEVKACWLNVVGFLQDHINSDPSLTERIKSEASLKGDSELLCEIHVDLEDHL